MKKRHWLVGCIIFLIGLYIWIAYTEVVTSTNPLKPTTLSSVEANRKGLLVRVLKPSPIKVNFNQTYEMIIIDAWLEKKLSIKNKLLLTHKVQEGEWLFRIKPLFKNRETGKFEKIEPMVYMMNPAKQEPFDTTLVNDTLSIRLSSYPESQIEVLVLNGEETDPSMGTRVNFK